MSYILDALRRAEAERERGSVPSLHSQQFPMGSTDGEAPRRPIGWMVAAGVLALALLGLGSWLWWAPAPQPVVVVAAPPPAAAVPATPPVALPAPPVVLPSSAPAPAAATPAATPNPAATAPRTARPTPRERGGERNERSSERSGERTSEGTSEGRSEGASERTRARTGERPTERTGERPTERASDRGADSPTRARERTATPAPEGDRVYTPSDLPEPARRALPALSFGGSSWSSDAGSRMVIWNGRVFHEGDTVAPGVVLRRIERRSALLVVQGHRVEIRF